MVTFADITRALGGSSNDQRRIVGASSVNAPRPNTVSFIQRWDPQSADTVKNHPETLFIGPNTSSTLTSNVVLVDNPRLSYALTVRDFLQVAAAPAIASTSVVSDSAEIGDRVSIGHFTVIEDHVIIGDDSVIGSHSVLRTGVQVGSNTLIGSHASIGGPGFGFEMDTSGHPIRIGHLGGVLIGDSVEIGQHVSIAQGTIEPTKVHDRVKIDDCVFIAHNVVVGENSFIIAGSEISGSVTIGRGVWISPEVAVINKVSIGDDALVGIGAVVVRDVDANTIVAGVPAKSRGPRYGS